MQCRFYFQTMREKHWCSSCLFFGIKMVKIFNTDSSFDEIWGWFTKTPTSVLIYLTKYLFLLYTPGNIKSWCSICFYYVNFFIFLFFLNQVVFVSVFLSLPREIHKTGDGLWMLKETFCAFSSFTFSSLFFICSAACEISWKFKGPETPHP